MLQRILDRRPASAGRDALIEAYFRHAAAGFDDECDVWAWDAVDDVVWHGTTDEVWTLVLDLLERAPDALMGSVAAGPLEYAIAEHGRDLIDRIEAEAASDSRFRRALGGVWLQQNELPPDVLARLVRASDNRITPLPARRRAQRRGR